MRLIYFIRFELGKHLIGRNFINKINSKFLESKLFSCHSLPWNQRTPLGYLGEIIFSIINMEAFLIVSAEVILIFIFMCKNNFIFTAMFVDFIEEFDRAHKRREKNDVIRKLVQFHNNVKRLALVVLSLIFG